MARKCIHINFNVLISFINSSSDLVFQSFILRLKEMFCSNKLEHKLLLYIFQAIFPKVCTWYFLFIVTMLFPNSSPWFMYLNAMNQEGSYLHAISIEILHYVLFDFVLFIFYSAIVLMQKTCAKNYANFINEKVYNFLL